jgi:hypothetical protein
MLLKVSSYNERAEREDLKSRYSHRAGGQGADIRWRPWGRWRMKFPRYGLKPEPVLVAAAASSDSMQDPQVSSSLDRLSTLKTVAMSARQLPDSP